MTIDVENIIYRALNNHGGAGAWIPVGDKSTFQQLKNSGLMADEGGYTVTHDKEDMQWNVWRVADESIARIALESFNSIAPAIS